MATVSWSFATDFHLVPVLCQFCGIAQIYAVMLSVRLYVCLLYTTGTEINCTFLRSVVCNRFSKKAGRDELKSTLNLKGRLSYFIPICSSISFQLFILSPFLLSCIVFPPVCCAPVSLMPAREKNTVITTITTA